MTDSDRRIDRYIGERMRERRTLLGLTLDDVADFLGVTYQQLQKYEKGINRISGGRLYTLAIRLDVPVGYFYENLDSSHHAGSGRREGAPQPEGSVGHREALEMMRLYCALEPDIRKSLTMHMRAITKHQS